MNKLQGQPLGFLSSQNLLKREDTQAIIRQVSLPLFVQLLTSQEKPIEQQLSSSRFLINTEPKRCCPRCSGSTPQPNAFCGLSRPSLPQQQRSTIPLKNALLAGSNLLSEFNAPGQPIPSASGVTICNPAQNTALQSREQVIQFATVCPYSDYFIVKEANMNTVGSATPLPPQPSQVTADSPIQRSKEWQKSMDTELRSHTRHKIALAIAPTPDVYAKLLQHHDIVGFVVKLESDLYDISDSLPEYCNLADTIMFYFKEIPYETYLQQKQAKVTPSHALTMPLQQLTSTHDPIPPQQQQMIPLSQVKSEQLDENNPSNAWQRIRLSSTNHVPAQNAALQSQEKGIDLNTACPMSPQNTGQCWLQRQQYTSSSAIGTQLSSPSSPARAAVGSFFKTRLLPQLIPLSTPHCDFNTEPFCQNLLPCHDIADPVQLHFAQTNFQSFQEQQSEPPSRNPVLRSNVPWIEESEQEQFGTVPRNGMVMLHSVLCSSEGMDRMPNEVMQQLQQLFDMVPLSLDRGIELLCQSLPGWSQINVMNHPVNIRLPFSHANMNLNVSQQQ